MKDKEKYNWNDIEVRINGKVIQDIKIWKRALTLSELTAQLQQAEENEEYEICAELKKEIDKLKNNPL